MVTPSAQERDVGTGEKALLPLQFFLYFYVEMAYFCELLGAKFSFFPMTKSSKNASRMHELSIS